MSVTRVDSSTQGSCGHGEGNDKCTDGKEAPDASGRLDKLRRAGAGPAANPRTTTREFGGPVGAACCVVLMPATVFALEHLLAQDTPGPVNSPLPESRWARASGHPLSSFPPAKNFLDPRASFYYAAWMAFTAVMYYFPWSREFEGVPLRDGKRLKYAPNAICTLILTLAVAAAVTYCYGPAPLVDIYDRIPGLIVASVVWSFVQSLCLYKYSFRTNSDGEDMMLSINGNSGNAVYDFFMGRELNPRIGSFDVKFVCELRPGLVGWMLVNLAAAAKQYQQAGSVTDSMILTILFQLWYVADSHINEKCVLTTMDITTDGFGFMLTFGDLVWVPFTFSLQARYLAVHPVHLGPWLALLVTLLNILGYGIFRGANKQKDLFRSHPDCEASKVMTYITTKTGSKLITSGWWGMARHINYLGDWIMGLAWCLPCGLPSFPAVPYFYAAYFAGLLLHRERRDDEKCARKYGGDWERYRRIVKWRIIPGVY